MILTILIPFAAYVMAEHVGCSGILAAVSAGMVMNIQSLRDSIPSVVRVRMTSTWTMIEFVFNGMVFILLGLQFPHIIGQALIEAHHDGNAQVGLRSAMCSRRLLRCMLCVSSGCIRCAGSRHAERRSRASTAPRPAFARSR